MTDGSYGIRKIGEESIALAAELIGRGELVVIPTDTVYGVAADPTNPDAVARIFAAKRRPTQKAVQVLLPSLDDLPRFGLSLPAPLDKLARALCPGGFSPICIAEPATPIHTLRVAEGERFPRTQGVRIPDSAASLAILEAAGPLATSSANRSGDASAQTIAEAAEKLGDAVALYLDGGPTPGPVSSTVAAADPDAEDGIAILREGVISRDKLKDVLRNPMQR